MEIIGTSLRKWKSLGVSGTLRACVLLESVECTVHPQGGGVQALFWTILFLLKLKWMWLEKQHRALSIEQATVPLQKCSKHLFFIFSMTKKVLEPRDFQLGFIILCRRTLRQVSSAFVCVHVIVWLQPFLQGYKEQWILCKNTCCHINVYFNSKGSNPVCWTNLLTFRLCHSKQQSCDLVLVYHVVCFA